MKAASAALAAAVQLVACLCLVSCSPREGGPGFYVVVRPSEAVRFLDDVERIAKEDGLNVARGRNVDDTGGVLNVLEGRRFGVTLWVQNVFLSGREDPDRCGVHHEGYPDAAQYEIYGRSRFPVSSPKAAIAIEERISAFLKKQGYDVRISPALCGIAEFD
jgi:hypothetical protein